MICFKEAAYITSVATNDLNIILKFMEAMITFINIGTLMYYILLTSLKLHK